jgi:hypothetical protein
MKKIFAIVTAVLILCSLTVPAMAAEASEASFTPSITYKPQPEIVPVEDEDGNEHIGLVKDGDGNVVGYLDEGCLIVTPIAHVWDEEKDVPADVEKLLTFVYNGLSSGEMELPYNLFTSVVLNPEDMVIRDLFDARWGCEEHPDMIAPEGVVIELTFDLGVAPDTQIFVMTYDEATGKWEPIVSTVNNGDGTVTCVFEHLCAIAFSMPLAAPQAAAPAAAAATSGGNGALWLILLGIAAVAVVAVLVLKNKKPAAK